MRRIRNLIARYSLSATLVLVAATFVVTALTLVGLEHTNERLSANVNAQVANRTANVRTWCTAINRGREYDRLFVQQVTHGRVQYRLADLPCTAIASATFKSAHHK